MRGRRFYGSISTLFLVISALDDDHGEHHKCGDDQIEKPIIAGDGGQGSGNQAAEQGTHQIGCLELLLG